MRDALVLLGLTWKFPWLCAQGVKGRMKKYRVVVISYDLATRMHEELTAQDFQVVIADECHYLKNKASRRSKHINPILRHASVRLMLSGTPALSRPRELWSQLNILDPELFGDEGDFLTRYCSQKAGKGGGKKRALGGRRGLTRGDGASNRRELHELLKATVMIRRRKKDILQHLPPKRRVLRSVEVEDETLRARLLQGLLELKRAEARLGKLAKRKTNQILEALKTLPALEDLPDKEASGAQGEGEDVSELQQRKKWLLMDMFMQTGMAKVPSVIARVRHLLADELSGKMLIFAHHRDVLDQIEKKALRNLPYIRIDGSTQPRERQARTQRFQTDASVRVALLSLTAAGVAITLTAANRAIFAELFWTPAALLQAEDRAHRIGQTSEVHIEYIFAKDSLDECLWPLIRSKMRVLGEVVEGAGKTDMDVVQLGLNDDVALVDKEISELAKEDVDRMAEGEGDGDADEDGGDEWDGGSERSDAYSSDEDEDGKGGGSGSSSDSDNDVQEVLCIDDSSEDEGDEGVGSQSQGQQQSIGLLKDESTYDVPSAAASAACTSVKTVSEGGREVLEIIDTDDEEDIDS